MRQCLRNQVAFSFLATVPLVLAAALPGCGGASVPRATIEGQVVIGGQPLKAGRISFIPIAPNEGPAATAMIVDGKYHMDRSDGPVVGPNRVEVQAELDLGCPLDDDEAFVQRVAKSWPSDPIPPEFSRHSLLTAVVKKGIHNRFDVSIPHAASSTALPTH